MIGPSSRDTHATLRRRSPYLREILSLLTGITVGAGLIFAPQIVHAERAAAKACHSCAGHGIMEP